MGWDEEKAQYIAKLENIVGGIGKILNMPGNGIVTPDMEKSLKRAAAGAETLLRKLRSNEFEIAVVGLEKAGKSSFSNAFIEFSALPTDDQRCTYTSTCIRAAAERSATISFYTRQEFARDFREKLETLKIANADSYSPDNLSLAKYDQLFEDCEDSVRRAYQDSLNQDIRDTLRNWGELRRHVGADTMTVDLRDVREFITSPAKAIAVKEVVIHTDQFQSMENAVMYDVPGFNSPTAMHFEQTLRKMQDADAIIMVAKADEPSITGDVLKIFRHSDMDGGLLSDKLFVFANKADRATDLEKNRDVTYEEWMRRRAILPDTAAGRERIVFGSANAHLGDQVPNGLKAREALARMGLDDGVENLRAKLRTYYRTTRFEVLKKRVGQIFADVTELFAEKRSEFSSGVRQDSLGDIARISTQLLDRLRRELWPKLGQLKSAITTDARENHPLRTSLENSIGEIITVDRYTLAPDEITTVHNEIAGIGAAPQPHKVDGEMRKRRFTAMYGDFAGSILSCTDRRHREVVAGILQVFMDAMRAGGASGELDRLKEETAAVLGLNDGGDEAFYQSLLERFARDLFEVQIMYTLDDRLHKFKEEAANFFSMGIFYSATASQDGNDLSYIGVLPADSPLWRNILYPERAGRTEERVDRSSILARFRELTGLARPNEEIGRLLNKVIDVRASGAMAALEIAFKAFAKAYPPARLAQAAIMAQAAGKARDILNGMLDGSDGSPTDLLQDILTGNRYQADIAAKRQGDASYDSVRREFDDDINALRTNLLNAFIPAVDIDKAFMAREAKLLEDVTHLLNTDVFSDFISRNIRVIAGAQMDRIAAEEDQRRLDSATMNEINAILDSIAKA